MKVMIIGSEGMLGRDLVETLKPFHEVETTTIETLDITRLDKTVETIKELKPEVVIHAAAYTDVDGSESKKDLAYQVNALGSRNVAVGCLEADASMVYISTDYVFDGAKGTSYHEYDKTNPLSVYGKSKLQGETFIQDILSKYYIVRTSWLYGEHGPNFPATMLQLAQENDTISVVNDQFGSPTFTKDLAHGLKLLIEKPAYGIYHLTNSDYCSWYEYAREIFKIKGVEVEVKPVPTSQFPRPAPRPEYSVLDNYHWKMEGFKALRSYKDALQEYLSLI